MSYPVRILSGTDNLTLPGSDHVYRVGDVIRNMSDETRLSLQRSGVRFEAVHEDTPPMPEVIDVAPTLPDDQRALNESIAHARKAPSGPKDKE